MKKELTRVMYVYQIHMMNAIIYCKHNNKNKDLKIRVKNKMATLEKLKENVTEY